MYVNIIFNDYCREEKAIELYKQMKMKCKSKNLVPRYENETRLKTLSLVFIIDCERLSVPEADVSSDSSEMVKAIIQTVQNQDKVLKDLYTHLR